jgi:hypothetical protein
MKVVVVAKRSLKSCSDSTQCNKVMHRVANTHLRSVRGPPSTKYRVLTSEQVQQEKRKHFRKDNKGLLKAVLKKNHKKSTTKGVEQISLDPPAGSSKSGSSSEPATKKQRVN